MKSTDQAPFPHNDPLRHVRQYVARELSQYPIYNTLIRDTTDDIRELDEKLLRATAASPAGSGSGTHFESGPQEMIPIRREILQAKLGMYQWRVRKTEMGLKYFEKNPEILKIIQVKYFTSHDLTTDQLIDELGYNTRRTRYYAKVGEIIQVFGKYYEVMP